MALKPTAGELRHRIAFDVRETVNPDAPDDFGNTESEFQEQFQCAAAFRPAGGSEAVQAARLEGRSMMRVYVRSAVETRRIGTDWRMRDLRRGTEYAIGYVDSVTDPAWVYIEAQSGVAI
ncbi:MAG: head-tail adaptor protein [Parvibaculaceae bacterium]